MKVLLYLLSILTLVFAGVFLVLCADQWMQYAHRNTRKESPSIAEIFGKTGNSGRESYQSKISPLISQSSEFALYMNPPAPPDMERPQEPQPGRINPPVLASRPGVSFRLLATSCNRSRPEDSLALVSEPGKGEHWVKKGDPVANFVLEKIEHGIIIYRNGSQLSEMAVEMKPPVHIAQEQKSSLGME